MEEQPKDITTYVIAPHAVIHALDVQAALVYGAVWGFCKMARGQCDASATKIAKVACVSVSTARKDLLRLVEAGFLSCEPGEVAWKPNTYRLTERVVIKTAPKTYRRTPDHLSSTDRGSIVGRYQKEKRTDKEQSSSTSSGSDQGSGTGRVVVKDRV